MALPYLLPVCAQRMRTGSHAETTPSFQWLYEILMCSIHLGALPHLYKITTDTHQLALLPT